LTYNDFPEESPLTVYIGRNPCLLVWPSATIAHH
jgi:hypothetical protein